VGNRWASADSGFPPSPFTPTVSTNFDAGNNQLQLQGSTYDSAGNQTSIGVQASTFDAEGRMTTNTLDGTTTYVYDGEGQRVMKQTSAGTTTYVYDAVGNLAAEYNTVAAASACGTPTCYVTVDQLGSTRVVTDSSGNVTRRYDYLPFGEEIPADGVVRTTGMGYQSSADGFNPKFTGQVRDVESGLDYFNARYYSPEQGRFVSADPQNAGSDPTNPQTWNGYAYVGGNPMTLTDPSGQFMYIDPVAGGGAGLGGIIGAAIPIVNAAIVGIDFLRFVFADISKPVPGPAISPIQLGSTTDPSIDSNGDLTFPSGGSGTLFGSGQMGPFTFSFGNQGAGATATGGAVTTSNTPVIVGFKAELKAARRGIKGTVKPLSTWSKFGLVMACIAGMNPDYAKPIGQSPSASGSTDSTSSTEGQGSPSGPNGRGASVPYGESPNVPRQVAGGTSYAASVSECIMNVFTAWPKR